jgi:hypothetical protein
VLVAGGGQSGLRVGGGGAALLAVRCGHPAGAGGSGVARAAACLDLLLAAIGPIALIGLGLMLYNALRFDSPFEFGLRYQLAGDRQSTAILQSAVSVVQLPGLFSGAARWSGRFPFVHDITVPPLPAGHGRVEHPFGVLTNIPLVWLALAVPLAWRVGRRRRVPVCAGFLTAVTLLFGICALTLASFLLASIRYEVEFLPALVLLAVIGILSLERALADRPVWRRAARWGWSLLLGFSVAFNLLASVERCAEAHNNLGATECRGGPGAGGDRQYEQALRLKPDFAEAHITTWGSPWTARGRVQEAIGHYEQAGAAVKPDIDAPRRTTTWGSGEAPWLMRVRPGPTGQGAGGRIGPITLRAGNLQVRSSNAFRVGITNQARFC